MLSKNKHAAIIRHGKCPLSMVTNNSNEQLKIQFSLIDSLLLMRQNEMKCQIFLMEIQKR